MKLLLGVVFCSCLLVFFVYSSKNKHTNTIVKDIIDSIELIKLKTKAHEAYTYCSKNNMNTDYCLLANMSKHSGKYRLYVWNFKEQTYIDSALVSHGCGNNPWSGTSSKEKPVFSNVDGSHCSSLGKYAIGQRAYSQWGIHIKYVLKGLNTSNSNAQARLIVLHSWDAIADAPVFPEGTPEGWGCPAVSNTFMLSLDSKLQLAKKPVLLWMFI